MSQHSNTETKTLQDVVIAEGQKVKKQGRDDHTKQSSTYILSFFFIHVLWKRIPVGGL